MADGIVAVGNDTITALGAALSYTIGNCTRWVSEQLSWIPSGLGDAGDWLRNAQVKGLPTAGPSTTPPIGSVAVWGRGSMSSFGHVAEVVGQIPGGFQVSEENVLGLGKTDIRNVTGEGLKGIIGFILPPSGAQLPVVGGLAQGVQEALTTPQAIAHLPASVGHGIADAGGALIKNAGIAVHNLLVPLLVAVVVALVIFGGDESK